MTSHIESRRIGGEFELSLTDLEFDTAPHPAMPSFGTKCEFWLDTGRSALAVIAQHLARTARGSTVWLPAYSCASIAGPFLRQGLRTRYYEVGASLDIIEVDPAPHDTVLFIHYFGVRNHAAQQRAEALRAAAVYVIEDCVQASLTTAIGTHGDYALTSLRKMLPQPDGALLASRDYLALEAETPDEAFVSARIVGKLQRGALLQCEAFLPLFEQTEARLADDRPRTMSWISRQLLGRSDLAMIAARRRANFAMLWQALNQIAPRTGVAPLLRELEGGEVPLGCPVVVDGGRRDALRNHLAVRNIFCPIHWDLAHVTGGRFSSERALSAASLTLPIDQRYGEDDMVTLLDCISTFDGVR